MNDDALIAAIERHENLSEKFGTLAEDRIKSLEYYLGDPLGNEVDGQSQVISRDVWDTVEWIKPQIADIFCSGEEVINFSPRGPEDVKAAEQETEYVNYIITQKNNWFQVFYGWMHDALLQKTGYVKACWDDGEDRTKEKYKGLTIDELQILIQDREVQPVEVSESPEGIDVTLERVKTYGCVKLHNVAPENILVSQNARGLDLQAPEIDFVEQREFKTLTQLRDEGFDVEDDLQDIGSSQQDWEENLRDQNNPFRNSEGSESDPSMRRVRVREVWIRFDDNDDGKAELLHVVVVGTTLLLKEECAQIPIVALCPTPLPHQHHGLSLADAVMDLQRIKTALLRGSLDNLYLANNGRNVVDQNTINLDDLLVSRPGGVVRNDGPPGMSIIPLTHTSTGAVSLPMMEYVDKIKTQRTGVNEQSQGLDSNSINKDTPYATTAALMSAAQQRIRFIARIFAETGVKSLFGIVHMLSLTHSRKEEIIKLRNQWVPVNPRQWTQRKDMQIAVGLGAGDKVQQMAFLEKVLQIQAVAAPQGLSTPVQVYNTLKRLTQAAGFKDPQEFWTDPSTTPPKPQGPPPEVQAEMAKGQVALQVEAAKGQTAMQLEQQKAQVELATAREQTSLKLQELQASLQLQASNDARDAERERMRAEYDQALEMEKLRMDQWAKSLQAEMDKYKADLQSATQLQIAEMNAHTTLTTTAAGIKASSDQADKQHEQKETEKKAKEAPVKKANDDIGKVLASIAQTQAELAKAISRPKTIIRDANGKVAGVQ